MPKLTGNDLIIFIAVHRHYLNISTNLDSAADNLNVVKEQRFNETKQRKVRSRLLRKFVPQKVEFGTLITTNEGVEPYQKSTGGAYQATNFGFTDSQIMPIIIDNNSMEGIGRSLLASQNRSARYYSKAVPFVSRTYNLLNTYYH